MTNEDKQLLLKDLCERLPYGVKVQSDKYSRPVTILYAGNIDEVKFAETGGIENINFIKPFLRPMSSMTEKETNEWHQITLGQRWITFDNVERCADWLNEHHFDYRGLIEKGLAVEASEGMYNSK